MEPAARRRDDDVIPPLRDESYRAPQWSPPLGGGMTRKLLSDPAPFSVPQWSPPLGGGMTYQDASGHPISYGAAMEPAARRRDDLLAWVLAGFTIYVPQWSPPLGGGMTLTGRGGLLKPFGAAMEPAARRRDDW